MCIYPDGSRYDGLMQNSIEMQGVNAPVAPHARVLSAPASPASAQSSVHNSPVPAQTTMPTVNLKLQGAGPPASWTGTTDDRGLFQGNGLCIYPDGSKYNGDMVNSIEVASVKKDVWSGKSDQNGFKGKGILTMVDGRRFEGEMKDGQMHGDGKMFYEDGSYVINCLVRGLICSCLCVYSSVILLSCSISRGALGCPDLLSSYFMIALALHNTIILIITHKSLYK